MLQEEISALLNKNAIRIVLLKQRLEGFYSRYFLVPKKEGSGVHPILDLRVLNMYLREYRFHVLTHAVCYAWFAQMTEHPQSI